MQAVILAGGASSRFYPYNSNVKALVKVAGEPIIVHTVKAIKRAGITDVVILTGPAEHTKQILGDGKKYGVKISYATLKNPTGMGDGLLACAKLIKSDFFVLHGHHLDFQELKDEIDLVRNNNKDVVLLVKKEESLSNFGVIKTSGDKVVEVLEKPEKGKESSNFKVIGVYFMNEDYIKTLRSVGADHYSFELALDKHAKNGKVRFVETNKATVSLKYPWDLLVLKDYLMAKIKRSISKSAQISKLANIEGNVVIEQGATISEYATIKGPAYIGKNTYVGSHSLVRNGTSLEEGSVVGSYMEVKNSLILPNSKTHSGHLEDSIVGENSRIGAMFTSANVRLDRKNVMTVVNESKVDSGRRDLGVMIGSNTYLGARVTTMPGIIIGNNVSIGPSTTVMENLPSDIFYYTEFKKIVKKNKESAAKNA